MSTMTITLDTDGAAFEHSPEMEAARILKKLATKLHSGEVRFDDKRVGATEGKLLDGYGNTCGGWAIT